MEYIKKLFGEKAMTYDEFATAVHGCKELKLANLAEGQYVDRSKYAQVESQLSDLKAKHEADTKAFGEQLGAQKKNACLELALTKAQAKNLTAAKALLKLDEIKLEGDGLTGLEEQLQTVMSENPFLFGQEQGNPPPPMQGSAGFIADDTAKWRAEAGLPVAGQ